MSPKHIKMKNFVEELKWRGMLAQIMPGTEEYLNTHLLRTQALSARRRCHGYDR